MLLFFPSRLLAAAYLSIQKWEVWAKHMDGKQEEADNMHAAYKASYPNTAVKTSYEQWAALSIPTLVHLHPLSLNVWHICLV